jgi:hypothetical protein
MSLSPGDLLEVVQSVGLITLLLLDLGILYLVLHILRRLGPDPGVLIPNDGLELGHAVPELRATDRRTGALVDIAAPPSTPVLLAFLSPGCSPCAQLVPALNAFANRRRMAVFVVANDGPGSAYSELLAPGIALLDSPPSLVRQFRAHRTPMVYLIDNDRVTMRGIPNDRIGLEDLVDGAGTLQGDRAWRPREESP